jgi:hypothetical protein
MENPGRSGYGLPNLVATRIVGSIESQRVRTNKSLSCGYLDQTQLREKRFLAHELCVDTNPVFVCEQRLKASIRCQIDKCVLRHFEFDCGLRLRILT